jgi:hypothetical protein
MSRKAALSILSFVALSLLYDFVIKPEIQRQISEGQRDAT